MIVCGKKDDSLRERLLCESELTLPKAMSADVEFSKYFHHRAKCAAYKRSAANVIEKSLTKLKKPKLNRLLLRNMNFSLIQEILKKTPEKLVITFQIKNELSDWNDTFSSNGSPISYKVDTGTHYNVTPAESLENISPKPDLQLVNVKLCA